MADKSPPMIGSTPPPVVAPIAIKPSDVIQKFSAEPPKDVKTPSPTRPTKKGGRKRRLTKRRRTHRKRT